MNEVLTYDEMKARFDGEWVLVQDPEVDEQMRVVRGSVISHSVDRDEMYQNAAAIRPKHSASLCFKKTPEGMVYIL